jgi:hypothetical protein
MEVVGVLLRCDRAAPELDEEQAQHDLGRAAHGGGARSQEHHLSVPASIPGTKRWNL